MIKAEKGDTVEVHYNGWEATNGTKFDSTYGKKPFVFTLGKSEVIPGFDNAITGMEVGEEKKVTIPKHLAYGEKIKELINTIPRSDFLGKMKLEVGKILALKSPMGNIMPGRIVEIRPTEIVVDMNPPLAGKVLVFQIKLLNIIKKGKPETTGENK